MSPLTPAPRTTAPLTLSLGLLLARVALGVTFAAHGWQKIVTWGVPATQEAFVGMGAPVPDLTGPLVGWIEIVAGVALVLGAATRVAAVLLAATAVGAIVLVHAGAGFFVSDGGWEFVFVLAAVAAALALTGAGRLSVDALVVDRRRGPRQDTATVG